MEKCSIKKIVIFYGDAACYYGDGRMEGDMANYTKQDILTLIEEEDIEFIRLQFVDIFGKLKNMAMTASQINDILDGKCKFDCAAIDGFSRPDVEELFLIPDLDTFEIFPWRPQHGKVARFICDVVKPDGNPFEGDSRYILKQAIKEAKEMGYTFDVGQKCEFFLFDTDENGEPTTNSNEKGSFFDIGPVDWGENARRDIVLYLSDMGIEVEASYHANEAAQHALDLKYVDALAAADNLMTCRLVTRTVAKRHGLHATFMPKPKMNSNGSGCHFAFSLSKDGINIFSDKNAETGISEEAYHFMAGVLEHIGGMTLVNNPIVNSYKRLTPGYHAKFHIGWSMTNRSPIVRLTHVGGDGSRMLLRSPDGACNPYLVLASCLAAGLEGIKRKLEPPKSMDDMTEEAIKYREELPSTLIDAVYVFEEDDFLHTVLGKHISGAYIDSKKNEWDEYCKQISQWEIERYIETV